MKQATTFQLVSRMNEAFNNPKGDPLNIDWPRVQKQCLNIPDEVGELFAALGGHKKGTLVHNNIVNAVHEFKAALLRSLETPSGEPDLHGVRDALCDIPVFSCGGQHMVGVDGDRDMRAVVGGVMTRFIKNDEDKEATIAIHAAKGVTEVYFEGEYPTMVMKSAVDQPDAPKGKFLKSASYTDAVFYDINEEQAPRLGLSELSQALHHMVWTGGEFDIKSVSTSVLAQAEDGRPLQMEIIVSANDFNDTVNDDDTEVGSHEANAQAFLQSANALSEAPAALAEVAATQLTTDTDEDWDPEEQEDEEDGEEDDSNCEDCDELAEDCMCDDYPGDEEMTRIREEAAAKDANECDCPPEGHSGCAPDSTNRTPDDF